MPRSPAPLMPMTLGNMRANGVRSLSVHCWEWHQGSVLTTGPWPNDCRCRGLGRVWCVPAAGYSDRCAAQLDRAAEAGDADRSEKAPNPSEQDLTRQFWQAPFWDNLMFAFRAVDHCVERHPLIFCATIAKQTDCCG
jgi:hypothetical protein